MPKNKKLSREELIDLKESPSDKYVTVDYDYLESNHCEVPEEVIESAEEDGDDELIKDWISENEDSQIERVRSY